MTSEFDLYRQAFQQHLDNADDGEGSKKNASDGQLHMDVAAGDRARDAFLERAGLQPPQHLRLIDCKSTCEEEQVVLIDWDAQQVGYSAISHTFGMEVYKVFDCECTSKCFSRVPRCSSEPCPQHLENSDPRNRVVKDILNICAILHWKAGVHYAWHDGVCIAQHNSAEVEETIKHIGWVYAFAKETIIFLHYVGRPMAPIGDIESRWQTRVWTLQEAALSTRRRYCVRVGITSDQLGNCQSLQEFEEKIALWFRDDSSKVAVIEEDRYWKILEELHTVLVPLCMLTTDPKAWNWCGCLIDWMDTLRHTCFQFPSVAVALEMCSNRDSKHKGDCINSILALSGVKDFVAAKDINVEASTIEFFRRQGQQGLARAVFTTNLMFKTLDMDGRHHTWVPVLSNPLKSVYEVTFMGAHLVDILDNAVDKGIVFTSSVEKFIEFTVLEDGKIQLRGELACLPVKFTVRSLAERRETQKDKLQHGSQLVVLAGQVENQPTGLAMDVRVDIDGLKLSLAQGSSLEMGTAVFPILKGQSQVQEAKSPVTNPLDGNCCCKAGWRRASELLWKLAARAVELCSGRGEPYGGGGGAVEQQLDNVASLISSGAFARACMPMMESGGMAVVQSVSDTGDLAPFAQAPPLELGRLVVPVLAGNANLRPLVEGREIQDGESFSAHLVLSLQTLERHREKSFRLPPSDIPVWDWSVPGLLVQGSLHTPVCKIGCCDLNIHLKDVLTKVLPSLTILHGLVIK